MTDPATPYHAHAPDRSATGEPETATRVVLLGASNLTRGLSVVLETARRQYGPTLDILAALGHGRSYGRRSRVLARSLPGIIECGLWDALKRRTPMATRAVVTDVGNDVAYGESPDRIIDWVAACLDRLGASDTTIGLPPIASIRTLGPRQFAVVKTMLFPRHELTFENALARAEALHDGLVELAAARGITAVPHPAEWYGFDPIHIRKRVWPEAWRRVFTGGSPSTGDITAIAPSLRRWVSLRRARADRWWLFGRPMRSPQPACTLSGGTTLALY